MGNINIEISLPKKKGTDFLTKAAEAKRNELAGKETMEEAWERVFSMKNSATLQKRLEEAKEAWEQGIVGRDADKVGKRFSKAEAEGMWRELKAIRIKEIRKEMVEETPDNYVLVQTSDKLDEVVEELLREDIIVFDIESTGVDVFKDKVVGHVLSITSTDTHYYIPTGHNDSRPQLDEDCVTEKLRPVYENESIKKIAHNAKYDYQMMKMKGVTVTNIYWDTQEAMKILNENEESYALKNLVTKYLGIESLGYADLFGKGTGFNEVELDLALAYAAKDGDITYKLYEFQKEHLARVGNSLDYFLNVEMPLLRIVSDMELNGYLIDRDFAKEYGDELRKEAEESYAKVQEALLPAYKKYVEKNNANPPKIPFDSRDNPGKPIILSVPKEINLNSPKQLKVAIEEYIGKPIENTDAKQTLKPLSKEYPIIAELLNYREKNKLLSTYIDALPELIQEASERLHANFNQNGTKTGRFSSNGPNLQNIPPESRGMFVAPSGHYIINADFSAQEVRIIASLSKEDVLLKAFADGMDAYASLASEFFGKPYEDCYKLPDGSDTPERKKMKVVLLMSMYGASKYGLAQALGITPDEASKFLDDFFKKYRKIDSFIKDTQKFANHNGFVWIGNKQRKRRLPDARGNTRQYDPKRNRAMRQGPNARVQGLAAIQTKMTMLELDKLCKRKGWSMYFTIHDEVGLLVGDDLSKEDIADIDRVMTQTYLFDGVDNATDIEVQRRWGDSITAEEYLNGKEVPKL